MYYINQDIKFTLERKEEWREGRKEGRREGIEEGRKGRKKGSEGGRVNLSALVKWHLLSAHIKSHAG